MPHKGVTLKSKSVRVGMKNQFIGIGVTRPPAGRAKEAARPVQASVGQKTLSSMVGARRPPLVYFGRKPVFNQQQTLFDKIFAWICSILIHAIVFMVALILYTVLKSPPKPPPKQMVVPESFYHSSATDRLLQKTEARDGRRLAAKEHSMESLAHAIDPVNANNLLSDSKAKRLSIIGVAPATAGTRWDVYTHGAGSLLGVPGGAVLGGATVTFFGVKARARSVVFIIDHSGSMIGRLHLVRAEVRRAINHLMPFQKFAIVVFAAHPYILGNQTGLVRATKPFLAEMDYLLKGHHLLAVGRNDGMVRPFAMAFRVAYAMKPDAIYFLTDGHFNPKLLRFISAQTRLNPVPVNTFSLLSRDPIFEREMRRIAEMTRGTFHLITRRQLYARN
jgi:hypothetical protein